MMPLTTYCQAVSDLAAQVEVYNAGVKVPLDSGAEAALQLLSQRRQDGNKVMILGNGGSSAIASHMHNDLAKAGKIRTLVFQDIPMLTAMANDHGYERAYDAAIAQWAEPGDVVILISSSGESANMLKAAATARQKGCLLLTMTGFEADNSLSQLGDVNFYVPVSDYGYVETIHALLGHYLTDMLKKDD